MSLSLLLFSPPVVAVSAWKDESAPQKPIVTPVQEEDIVFDLINDNDDANKDDSSMKPAASIASSAAAAAAKANTVVGLWEKDFKDDSSPLICGKTTATLMRTPARTLPRSRQLPRS
jgi:hypothetical protein